MAVAPDVDGSGTPDPDRVRRLCRFLPAVALAVALLPFVVSAVALLVDVGDDYHPLSDHALTEMQIRDVGHHEVLTGLFSRDGWRHPGPLFFYLVAPIYWLTGQASIAMNLGALLVNAAAVTGMALVARRRGGTPLLVVTLLACTLLVRTLGPEFVHDPWNNYVTVLPFALMVFLAWAMTAGETWALPVGAGVASFLGQTHIGFLVLALPLLGWGAAWLVVGALRSGDRDRRRRLRRPVAVTAAVLGVLWLPPLLDLVVNEPNNAGLTLRYFQSTDELTHSALEGWRIVSAQFAAVPEWLTRHQDPSSFTGEPPSLTGSPVPVLFAAVVVAAVVFRRRRVGDGWRLVLTLAVSLGLGVLAVTRTVGLAYDYRLWWRWVPGMVGFVVVLWAAWLLVRRWSPTIAGRWLLPLGVVGLLAASSVNVATAAVSGTPQQGDSEVVAELVPPILDAVSRIDGEVLFTGTDLAAWYTRGLVLQAERHGVDARVPLDQVALYGEHRVQSSELVGAHLDVVVQREIPIARERPDRRLVAEWSLLPPAGQAQVERALSGLAEDLDAGRLTLEAYDERVTRLERQIRSGPVQPGQPLYYAVAVFLVQDA